MIILTVGVGMPRIASACSDPPPSTTLTTVIISLGPPVTVTLIFDPWTTFASASTQFCSCAFRFPTALIDTIDEVRLVATGTNILVPGFEVWTPDATTSADVESQVGAGAGKEWFGFFNDLSAGTAPGVEADFQVDVTLMPGITETDLILALHADNESMVFSDEADATGLPTGNHAGFVGMTTIPAMSPTGLAIFGLLLMMAPLALWVVRRRQETS